MDSNKDEAERCIKIALNAVSSNQPDKARKFLEKAQRLFPTEKAKGASSQRVSPLDGCVSDGGLSLGVIERC